ncbi:MAG: FMN-binding protein [Sediminispirochaetaceae bacterium]
MKKDSLFAARIYPIIFMVLVTAVFISGVSGIYLSTKERVLLNESIFQKMAVLYAAGIEYPEGRPQEIQAVYEESVREVGSVNGEPAYFEVELPSGAPGYVVYTRGAGLWGEIVAAFGFEQDLNTITGVEFVEQNETPGLGARITEEWFKQQFRGKKGPFVLVEEGTADETNELDAITGATRTSDAVLKIANNAFEVAEAKVKGGN